MNWTLVIIGIVLILLGIVAGTFTVTEEGTLGLEEDTDIPYSVYMIPLIVGGLAFLIIGGFINNSSSRGKKE